MDITRKVQIDKKSFKVAVLPTYSGPLSLFRATSLTVRVVIPRSDRIKKREVKLMAKDNFPKPRLPSLRAR